jgi:hypothetical protein
MPSVDEVVSPDIREVAAGTTEWEFTEYPLPGLLAISRGHPVVSRWTSESHLRS